MTNLVGSTSERSRIFNERIILQLIRRHPEISRQEISKYTRLSAQTISVITANLIAEELIVNSGKVEGKRGQPQKKLTLNGSGAYGLGINVDRDYIGIALVDFEGRALYHSDVSVSFPNERDAKSIVINLMKEVQVILGDSWGRVRGIGISLPDYMEQWTESLGLNNVQSRSQGDLGYWNRDCFEKWLGDTFSLPVFRENDARAAAMCELFFSTSPLKHFFYLYISTAVGGCVVENGECLNGADQAAGQFGLLYTKTGVYGERVLEALSLTSLQKYLVSTYGKTLNELSSEDDQEKIYHWGKLVANEVEPAFVALLALVNPNEIRIGGRIPDWMIKPLSQAISEVLIREEHLTTPSVRSADYSIYSGALGAAVLPLYYEFAPQTSLLKLG